MKPQNRTFIISGGSSGLGLATAHNLLDVDAFVSILDLNENVDLSKEFDKRVKFFKVDITKDDEVNSAVEGTVAWTHETGAHLGGVINCAGVATAAKIIDARGDPHSLDLWNFAIAVNLTGTFNLSRLVCKHLVQVPPEGVDNERGIVIFVASSAAFEGQPGQAAYAASKGALVSAVLPLSRDLARHGVRVTAIAPGAFASAMTDRMLPKTRASLVRDLGFPQRFGEGHEFAQTVRWMVECAYVNGETIRLSGGSRLPGRL
ncbi:short chain type dehydrogenase [Phellopilus nigrolimitatus]|nr:short chain type dehydrogenase [Phellopilus nigrolimitatus]